MPGTGGFIAEFLCIAPLYSLAPTSALLMSLTLILSGLYSLWAYTRLSYGLAPITGALKYSDLSLVEIALSSPLLALAFLLGSLPGTLLTLVLPQATLLSSSP